MPVTERSARFEELVFDQDAHAELLGPGCTDEHWATIPCSSGLALGGGTLTFHYPGDKAGLVRKSKGERRSYEALPEHVRIMLRGEELRRWSIPKMPGDRPVRMLPGDSLNLNL